MHRHEIHFATKDVELREDVHALGSLVGDMLREQGGNELFERVEGDRVAAIRRREGEGDGIAELTVRTLDRPPTLARDLVRAFSTWFQMVNIAENVHRIRRRRQYFSSETAPQPFGIGAALLQLKQNGHSLEQTLALLRDLHIEPVLRAHPTESTRRTILRKQQRIARLLLQRLDPLLTPQETRSVFGQLRSEITTGWQTEEHPRQRLTVADEREHVLFYLAEILYRIVPAFYEELESALERVFDAPAGSVDLPDILHFGSWVGGDMDANPEVHAKTIRETLARHHQVIVSTYFSECQKLAGLLSQSASRVAVSPALQKRIDEYNTVLPSARLLAPARHDRMPYRVFFAQLAERLRNSYDGKPNHYDTAAQLLADVELAAESLKANRGLHAGYHAVRRLLKRIRTFGFHLATLHVRQHRDVHQEVLARGLGMDGWMERTPDERLEMLRRSLERDRGPVGAFDALGRRTLTVFEAMTHCRHKYGRAAIGEYIVSGARHAEDVLGVLLLARWAEVAHRKTGEVPFDIVPLFDSVEALHASGGIMQRLLAEPLYCRHLRARGSEQIVLVGYSGSDKEAGITQSRWAAHCAQAELVGATKDSGFKLTLCHARGGTISRGGGRTDALVRSAPPGAIKNTLQVTEQGEILQQNYGLRPIAMRSLERALHALALGSSSSARMPAEDAHFCAAMGSVAEASGRAYQQLVRQPRFYDYFRQVTPIDVIERMHIGSRPASRGGREGFEFLRPAPWVFAWTQTRVLLPGWYGVGTGLQAAQQRHGTGVLREMQGRWFFFSAFLDDIEAMLARADFAIAGFYNELADPQLRSFLEPLREEFALTCAQVLDIKGHKQLLDGNPTLQRSIMLRNPYVDPMNLMQIDLLGRWRRAGRQDPQLFAALLDSITGISQGLQSTG